MIGHLVIKDVEWMLPLVKGLCYFTVPSRYLGDGPTLSNY